MRRMRSRVRVYPTPAPCAEPAPPPAPHLVDFANGSRRIRGVWLEGNAAARQVVAGMLAPSGDLGAAHTTLANSGSTDHMRFVGVGVPGFTFLQDSLDYHTRVHHTAADVAAKLQAAALRKAGTVAAGMLWQAANHLGPPGPRIEPHRTRPVRSGDVELVALRGRARPERRT